MVSGAISARYHTRDFLQITGLLSTMPVVSVGLFFGVLLAGGFPLGIVFTSEAHAVSTALYGQSLSISGFILVIYSLIFLRLVSVYIFMIPGVTNPRATGHGPSSGEYFGVLCLAVIMVLVSFYSLELSSTLLLSVWPRLMPRQISDFIEVNLTMFHRIRQARSFRWMWGGIPREPEQNFGYEIENETVRRRRLVKYILNALRFRDQFGFITTRKYDTKPIRPRYDLPYEVLADYIARLEDSCSPFTSVSGVVKGQASKLEESKRWIRCRRFEEKNNLPHENTDRRISSLG